MGKFIGKACYIQGVKDLFVQQREIETDSEKVIVKISRGGICGSDINYYFNGGVGDLKLQHPMLLGHEVIGKIAYIPNDTLPLKVGQKVAVNPSLPCKKCKFCLEGKPNHCLDMKFFGSAMRNPHIHGGFADYIAVEPEQCVVYDQSVDDDVMCFAEPLSVAIHAVNQAGSLVGKNILVSGAGPIGCLVIAAAIACGAKTVTVFDISEKSRTMAKQMGADVMLDPRDHDALLPYKQNKGYFDISFDATGVDVAIQLAIQVTAPTGTLVQVGNSRGLMGIPTMDIVSKELSLRGTFRFNQEFFTSVHWLQTGKIDPLPLLSAKMSADEIEKAILLASDKTQSAKVQIIFD